LLPPDSGEGELDIAGLRSIVAPMVNGLNWAHKNKWAMLLKLHDAAESPGARWHVPHEIAVRASHFVAHAEGKDLRYVIDELYAHCFLTPASAGTRTVAVPSNLNYEAVAKRTLKPSDECENPYSVAGHLGFVDSNMDLAERISLLTDDDYQN